MPEPTRPYPLLSPEIQAAVETARDADHLHLLEIVFYIAGGMTAFFSCLFLLHFTMFLVLGLNPQMFPSSPQGQHVSPPPSGIFLAFAAIIGIVILIGWTFGALQIYAGRCLRHRQNWIFIFTISILECAFIPWGTTIGVFALLLLSRPTVKALFARN
jgi:hypothetical protein